MRGCLLVVLWLIGGFVVIAIVATVADRMTGPPPQQTAKAAAAESEAAGHKVSLVDYSWRKGGFNTVMIATFTIANGNDFAIKDLYVACELSARSGTTIGVTAVTIYDTVPARGRKTFREINMGSGITLDFNQAASASCKLGPFKRG